MQTKILTNENVKQLLYGSNNQLIVTKLISSQKCCDFLLTCCVTILPNVFPNKVLVSHFRLR